MTCYISELPDHILEAILCKLPVISLTQCRYVCKSWHEILLNPDFVKFHLSLGKSTDLFLCNKGENLYWLEFEGETHSAKLNCQPDSLVFLNSCNGLVCFSQDDEVLRIMNPITCEYISYPPCEKGMCLKTRLCGVGFDSKAKKFKVLRVTHPREREFSHRDLRVEICTLGNGEWISIVDVLEFEYQMSGFHAFVNGSLHCFVGIEDWDRDQILVFDFEMEQFKSMLLPPVSDSDFHICYNMGVSRDSLYLYRLADPHVMEVWLMKEYGIVESWTKTFVVDVKFIDCEIRVNRVMLLENGDVLVFCGLRGFFM